MPPIKWQPVNLKNVKLALIRYFKKQKLERNQSINTEQLRIEDNWLFTNNSSDIKDRKSFQFWNERTNKTDSDWDCNKESDKREFDCGPEKFRTGKEAVLETRIEKYNRIEKEKKNGRESMIKFLEQQPRRKKKLQSS